MQPNSANDDIYQQLEEVISHPWVERSMRFGFLAKGVVYLIMGLLAARAVIGIDEVTGTSGVLIQVAEQPFGQFLLIVLAIGLIGYVLWRLIQATIDPEYQGKLSLN